MQKLKEQEAEDGISSRPRRPRALILGPTRELTDQILRVAKSISHHAKFRSTCVNGGELTHLSNKLMAWHTSRHSCNTKVLGLTRLSLAWTPALPIWMGCTQDG